MADDAGDRFLGKASKRGVGALKGYGQAYGEGAGDPVTQALLGVRRNLGEVGRAVVGAKPYDETNPTESYRAVQALMNAPMKAAGKAAGALSGLGALGVIKPRAGEASRTAVKSTVDPQTDITTRLTTPGRTSIVPVPNRWFSQPEKFPQVQPLVEKILATNNMTRADFPSGAFVNPRTGEILDRKVMEDVGVIIDPATNRPIMSAAGEAEPDIGGAKQGALTKSNLVRRQLYKPEGDPLLDKLKFIATVEQSGMGHKYGLGTEYATPVEMYNTMTGDNPTLRPKSRGDVFGMGDVVGRVTLPSGIPHDVYESLFIAPKKSDVPGVKLSKAKGGAVKPKTSRLRVPITQDRDVMLLELTRAK